jgi:hypothetical protein
VIVKVQIDMTGTKVLIYNEHRDVWYEAPADEALLGVLPGPYPTKAYMEASLNEEGQLNLDQFVEEQDW